jgi:hypothetical protein
MKSILAPILLLTLLFPSLAFGVTMDDLVERPKWSGIYYKKFTEVPFTGKVTGQTQGSFKDGKQDGPQVTYHDNGQLWGKGTFKNGKGDGLWVRYYDNGQLHYKGTYKDGKRYGFWVYYNKDGTVWRKGTGTYKNGVKVN